MNITVRAQYKGNNSTNFRI